MRHRYLANDILLKSIESEGINNYEITKVEKKNCLSYPKPSLWGRPVCLDTEQTECVLSQNDTDQPNYISNQKH